MRTDDDDGDDYIDDDAGYHNARKAESHSAPCLIFRMR